jgi:hypothetical protein
MPPAPVVMGPGSPFRGAPGRFLTKSICCMRGLSSLGVSRYTLGNDTPQYERDRSTQMKQMGREQSECGKHQTQNRDTSGRPG